MKYLSLIIFIAVKIGFGQSFPLTLYNVSEFKTCEEADKQAKQDFDDNKIWSMTGALDYFETDYPRDFIQLYETYFYAKYNIKFFMPSEDCIASPEQYCYVKTIDKIILKKFGKDFFEKEKREIEKTYKNSRTNSFSEIIDFDKAYSYLDSEPKFIGNNKTLIEFIKRKFKVDLAQEILNFDTITLIIGSNGKLVDYKVNDSKVQHKSKEKTILELSALGDWVPGYLYGQKVNSECQFIDFL